MVSKRGEQKSWGDGGKKFYNGITMEAPHLPSAICERGNSSGAADARLVCIGVQWEFVRCGGLEDRTSVWSASLFSVIHISTVNSAGKGRQE